MGAIPVKWTFKKVGPVKSLDTRKEKTPVDSEREFKEWSNKIDRRSLIASVSGFCLTALIYGAVNASEHSARDI